MTTLMGTTTSSETVCVCVCVREREREREFLGSESETVFWLWICICRDTRENEIVKCDVVKGGSERVRECGFEWEIETSYKSLFTLLDFKFYLFHITPFF